MVENKNAIIMMRGLIILYLFLFSSCTECDKWKVFNLSSPDGQYCLSFAAEYDFLGGLQNHRMYVMGHHINKISITFIRYNNFILNKVTDE